MKIYQYILPAVFLVGGLTAACTDNWDEHYSKQESVLTGTVEMEISDQPAVSYLQSKPEYKSMSRLFEETGLIERLNAQSLPYTLFVVGDELADVAAVAEKGIRASSDAAQESEAEFLAKGHITTASVAPSSLRDGQRLKMWNNKYVDVHVAPLEEGGPDVITFTNNHCRIKKVIKVDNGYIYELDQMINTPKTMLETLEGLGDEYSIFKEMVLSRNIKMFDKANSTPLGPDASGNTVYDSVFTVRNPYFEAKGMDIMNDSKHYTMFIPSNDLITKAFNEGKAKLAAWQQTRPDSTLMNWCFQSMFFKTEYKPENFAELESKGTVDITSAFGKQWRFTVNKVDLNNPITMSNGTAYYVTDLKLPHRDVLIWRYKERFTTFTYLYNAASRDDLNTHYVFENITIHSALTKNNVAAWVPDAAKAQGWPKVENTECRFYVIDANAGESTLVYTPYWLTVYEDNSYDLHDYIVPTGEYTLHVGFGTNGVKKATNKMDISLNGELVASLSNSVYKKNTMDRWGGGYPEYWNTAWGDKYDRDGPEIGTVYIQNDELKPITITFRAWTDDGKGANIPVEHWALRPTVNNY